MTLKELYNKLNNIKPFNRSLKYVKPSKMDENEVIISDANNGKFESLIAALKSNTSTSICLLGDSTANATDEWFYLTVQELMKMYPSYDVKYSLWNPTNQNYDVAQYLRVTAERHALLTSGTSTEGFYLASSSLNGGTTITGDIDIRAKIRAINYTSGTEQCIASKFGAAGQRSWRFQINTVGRLEFQWSADGTNLLTTDAGVSVGASNNTDIWVRVTLDVDNGSSGYTVKFYTSADGSTWTQSGNTTTAAGVTSIFNSTTRYEIGSRSTTASLFFGRIYLVEIRSGIDGPIITPASIDSWFRSNTTVSFAGAPMLTVFNGSHPGAYIVYLADDNRTKAMLPPDDYSCIIISCSHNDAHNTGASYLSTWDYYLTAIKARIKTAEIVITTQNPRKSPASYNYEHARRRTQLLAWAKRNAVSIVDVYGMFLEENDYESLIASDGIHPTNKGSQLWADIILKTIKNHI